MPTSDQNGERLSSREVAAYRAHRIKLVSALRANLEKTELPVRQIVEEIGATRDAIRSWQSGKANPQFKHLDGIAAFLKRHRNDRRLRDKVLGGFERFYTPIAATHWNPLTTMTIRLARILRRTVNTWI
jgi:hypothetical protein